MIQMSITDNGIGIQDRDKDKLFELFGFLATTQKLNTKGIGLGLHISKQIVQQFGGDIDFDSKWQKGTTFTYVLALDQQTKDIQQLVKRTKNPSKKAYPKIIINRDKRKTDELNQNETSFSVQLTQDKIEEASL